MTQFNDTMRQIARRLDLPQPFRARVLLEIAADLHDLERHFLDQGLSEEEAQRRAIEHCDLSDEAISGLVRVHAGGYRRFLERLGAQARTRWERLFLAVILVFVALTSGRLVLTAGVFRAASAFVWPVLASTFLAVSVLVVKYHAAFLRQSHDSRRLRAGLTLAPGLATANLMIGMTGLWLGLYLAARRTALDSDHALTHVRGWMLSGSATLIVSLVSALLIAILWFVLARKIARIEESEAEILLAEQSL